jgi:hypothetical protein
MEGRNPAACIHRISLHFAAVMLLYMKLGMVSHQMQWQDITLFFCILFQP